jgi:hypothetical protein
MNDVTCSYLLPYPWDRVLLNFQRSYDSVSLIRSVS